MAMSSDDHSPEKRVVRMPLRTASARREVGESSDHPGGRLPRTGATGFDGTNDDDEDEIEDDDEPTSTAARKQLPQSFARTSNARGQSAASSQVIPGSDTDSGEDSVDPDATQRPGVEEEEEPVVERQESPYLGMVEHGYWKLIKNLMRPALDGHPGLKGTSERNFWTYSMQLFLCMPEWMLHELLEGNLQRLLRKDRRKQQYLDELKFKSKVNVATHYLFEFVHRQTGESPTPTQLLQMIEMAERYLAAEDDDPDDMAFVQSIESWKFSHRLGFSVPKYKKGFREYLPNDDARENLRVFLDALKEFLAGEPQNEPLNQPLREVGYTDSTDRRVDQHQRHSGSNYLMDLFEAIAKKLKMPYENQWVTLSICFEKEHGVVGEVIWSLLAQSYYETGRGFNHQRAGESNSSVWTNKNIDWMGIAEWTLENTPFVENREAERTRRKKMEEKARELREEKEDLMDKLAHPWRTATGGTATQSTKEGSLSDVLELHKRNVEAGVWDGDPAGRKLVEAEIRQRLEEQVLERRKLVEAVEKINGILGVGGEK